MENSKKKPFPWQIKFVLALTTFVAIFTIGTYYDHFAVQYPKLGTKNDFGLFGDYIGGVLNPVLSFLTVALLIWSIRIQLDELSKSTTALEATQKAQEKLVEISKQELSIVEKGHLNQQHALKIESKRNQLTENAESIIKTFDQLMNEPFFNSGGLSFSPHDLLYNVTSLGDMVVENNIANIQKLMTEKPENRNDKAKILQLESIKKNMQHMTLVFKELKPMLEINCLQIIWVDRLKSRAIDCYGLTIFTAQELEDITESIEYNSTKPLF